LLTWKSVAFMVLAGGFVLAWFEYEKRKRLPKTEMMGIGKAAIGGPYTLVNQWGVPVTSASFHGRYTLLYFGFTFCPDICPAELAKITKALNLLTTKEGIPEGFVVPIFISVDPYRDTIEKIRIYLKDFHQSFVGLTGTPQQIEAVTRAFRVYSASSQHSEEDEDYLVDHSIFLYLMDKKGNYLSHHGSDVDAELLAHRIAEDIRAQGDCPLSPWMQAQRKIKQLLTAYL